MIFEYICVIYYAVMYLALFGFLQMSLTDILDILLLAILIFILFKWIRGSSAMSIFIAIVSLYLLWCGIKTIREAL